MVTYQGVLASLGEESRVRILELLKAAPASVGQLAEQLPISRPAVSQHLGVLQEQALVTHTTVGTRHVYRVDRAGFEVLRVWLDDFWSTAFDSFVDYAEKEIGHAHHDH